MPALEFAFALGLAGGEVIAAKGLEIARLMYGPEPTTDFEDLQKRVLLLDEYADAFGFVNTTETLRVIAEILRVQNPQLDGCATVESMFRQYFLQEGN